MLRRALNFSRKICEKRGSILCPSFVAGMLDGSPSPAFHEISIEGRNPYRLPHALSSWEIDRSPQDASYISPWARGYASGDSTQAEISQPSLDLKRRKQKTLLSFHRSSRSGPTNHEKISALTQLVEDSQVAIPQALSILDMDRDAILVKEAIQFGLPVVAILDNQSDPFGIQFPIPGSNSPESLPLYISCVKKAMLDGKRNEVSTFFFA